MDPEVAPPVATGADVRRHGVDPATDRVILFGGSEDEETAAFDDTWAYDYDGDAWEQIETERPTARAWHAMALDDESGLVVPFGGGVTREDDTDEVWTFDPAAARWSRAA